MPGLRQCLHGGKTTKRDGTLHVCPNRDCRHQEPAEPHQVNKLKGAT
jgi:hypothetical protein